MGSTDLRSIDRGDAFDASRSHRDAGKHLYHARKPNGHLPIANEAAIVDRQGNTLTELAVAELIESGSLRRHTRKALQIYPKRRDAFAASLQSALGNLIEFSAPGGGLAFWVKFRDPSTPDAIEENAASQVVRFLHSRTFEAPPYHGRGLRLGFGSLEQSEAEETIWCLYKAVEMGVKRVSSMRRNRNCLVGASSDYRSRFQLPFGSLLDKRTLHDATGGWLLRGCVVKLCR